MEHLFYDDIPLLSLILAEFLSVLIFLSDSPYPSLVVDR